MADEFKAQVDVVVSDSELDKLEQRINEIGNKKIKLDIEVGSDPVKKLSKNIEDGLKKTKLDTSSIANQMAESFNIKDKSVIGKMKTQINSILNDLGKTWDGAKFDFSKADGFYTGIDKFAETIKRNASIIESKTGIYEKFYSYFKDKKVFISDELKNAMGADLYKEISNMNVGKIVRDASKGISINNIWSELTQSFPEHFSQNVTNEVDQVVRAFEVLKAARADVTKSIPFSDMSEAQRLAISDGAYEQVADIARKMKASLEQNIQAATESSKTTFDLDVDINTDKVISDIRNALKTASGSVGDALDIQLKLNETEIASDLKNEISKINNGDEPVSVDIKINKESLQADINTALENLDIPIHFNVDATGLEEEIRKTVDSITDLEVNLKFNNGQPNDNVIPDIIDPIEEVRQRVQNNPIKVGYEADTSSITTLVNTADRVFDFFTGTDIYNFSSDKIRQAISDLKELNSILVEVDKTGNLTHKQLTELGNNSYDNASRWGAVVEDYLSSSETFAQAGFSNLEEMSDLSTMAQMAGQMTAETATKFLIASDAAWQMKGNVEKLTSVLDGMNMITNKNALEMTDLANGIRVAGSMMANSGLEEDQAAALIGTGVATTKDSGETVARGVRTIVMNLRQIKGETEGEIIDDESLKKVEQTCNSVGVSLKTVKDGIVELRNPIDVLRELSEVYNSLDTMDARRAAITDDIAGKHRSNILSSILTNFDMYDKMLQDYSEGAGSAFDEAMKTADSWEGRLNSLKNQWTEFVSSFVDTDIMKGSISGLESMIVAMDKLNEAQLFIPTMISSIMGLQNVFTGKGLTDVSFNDKDLKLEGSLFGIDFTKQNQWKSHFEEAKMLIEDWNKEVLSGQIDLEDFGGEFVRNNENFKKYISTVQDGSASLDGYKESLAAAGVQYQKFSMKSVLANAATGFLVGAGLELGVAAITKIYDDVIHRQERLIEAGEEAKSTISDTFESFSKGKSAITDMGKSFADSEDDIKSTGDAIAAIAEKYSDLSKGVNGFNNENKSLSSEDYQAYLDTCNQLAEQFPTLVSGYDAQGNAILNLGNNASDAADKIRDLYDAQQLSANVEIGNNLQTAYEGITAQISQYEKQISNFEEINKSISNEITEINGQQQQTQEGLFTFGQGTYKVTGLDSKKRELINGLLGQYGLYSENIGDDGIEFNYFAEGLADLTEQQVNSLNEQYANAIGASLDIAENALTTESNHNKQQISSNELMIKDQWRALSESLGQYLQTADSFTGLDAGIQNAIVSNLGNIDLSAIYDKYEGKVLPFIYGEFIEPISGLQPEAQQAIGELFDIDKSETTLQEYTDKVNDTLGSIFGNKRHDWSKKLGFNEIYNEAADNTRRLRELFKDNVQDIEKLPIDDRETAIDIIVNDGFSGTYDQLIEKIHQVKEEAEAIDLDSHLDFDAIDAADESKNAGDDYKKAKNYLEEAKKLYESGEVGTDDFKARAAYFSPTGATDAANFAENYEKAARYLTDDSSGVKAFLDDLQSKGYATFETLEDGTKKWSYEIDDLQAASKDMGMGFEWFMDMFGRLEDYGFANDFVSSTDQGLDHLATLYGNLATAQAELQELEQNDPGNSTAIEAKKAEIENLNTSINNTKTNLENLLAVDTGDADSKVTAGKSAISSMLTEIQELDKSSINYNSIKGIINDQIEEIAAECHITLSYDSDGNVTGIVEGDLEEAQSLAYNNPIEFIEKTKASIEEKTNNVGTAATPSTEKISVDTSDIDTAKTSIQELKDSCAEFPELEIFVNGAEQLVQASEAVQNIENSDPSVDIVIGTDEVSEKFPVLEELLDNLPDAETEINANDNASPIISNVSGALNVLDNTNPISDIRANDYASSVISSVDAALSSLNGKVANVTIHTTRDGGNSGGLTGGFAMGTAHADGTAYNMLNLNPAYSDGRNIALPHDENALCNELGTEGLIRDGKLYAISGGMHVQAFKKGDIILSAKQMSGLLKTGKALGHGKPYGSAYANGTAHSLLNAYVGGGGGGSFQGGAAGNTLGSSTNTSTQKNNQNTTKAAKSAKKSLDDILESLEKLYDWIEVNVTRLQQKIDLITAKSDNAVGYQNKNTLLTDAQTTTAALIKANEDGAKRYKKQADSAAKQVGLSSSLKKKVDNGTIDIQSLSEDNKKRVEAYKQWYDKMKDCQQAIEDLKASQRDLAQQKLDNVIGQFDSMLSHIEHQASLINGFADQTELKGYIQSAKYYDGLIKNAAAQKAEMEKERAALVQSLQESVNQGIITVGSVEWANMQSEINGVTEAIQEAGTSILEFKNNIREINWGIFDKGREMVSRLTDEADFLIQLMGNDDLFDDKGRVTNQGMATAGLHGSNYNTYMEQANEYRAEVERISQELANDPYNQDLVGRRNELLDLQQESIKAAEDEKQAIKGLVEDGIEKQLSALQDLIDKYTDALDSQKELYDYQNNISDQTKELSSLYKQFSVYSNDSSEEGRLKAQETKNAIEEAKAKLEETEYDKYFSDQKELLDTLYKEYEDVLNGRLDNVDQLVSDVIQTINDNAGSISDTLHTEADAVGYRLTEPMESIWGQNGSAMNVLSTYNENFSSTMTTLQGTVDNILAAIRAATGQSDVQAEKDINTAETNNANNPAVTGKTTPAAATTPAPAQATATAAKKSTGTQGDGNIQVGDKVTFKSGKYYGTSAGGGNSGSKYLGKTVYITKINKGSKKPYHISTGKKLGSGDLGWLTKSQISGYAKGTDFVKQDELARVNEEGQEIITLPDGSFIMPLQRGAGVVNNPNTEKLMALANDYDKIQQIIGSIGVSANAGQMKAAKEFVNTVATNNVVSNNTGGEVHVTNEITFNLPNVTNYEEFVSRMKLDKRVTNHIHNVIDPVLAGSSPFKRRK